MIIIIYSIIIKKKMTSNFDTNYAKNFKESQAAKNIPAFINAKGDN